MEAQQPLVVYFPDLCLWLSKAVSKSSRKEFVSKMQKMFDQLSGPLVLICGQNKAETGSKEKEKFVSLRSSIKCMICISSLLTRGDASHRHAFICSSYVLAGDDVLYV